MRFFPGFGGWINQNTLQTLNAESNRSENDNSKSASENDSNNAPAKEKKIYYDEAEETKQDKLWHNAEKKEPWYDAPLEVKVTRKKGIIHMNIEFTAGASPDTTYDLLTNGTAFFDHDKWRRIMENKSVKVLKEDGPREITKLKKAVMLHFLWWSISIPMYLIVDENRKDLTDKSMFLKVFEGSYKVEPIYADAERLCRHKFPKSREEYMSCSGGQGRIASKVTMNQYVQPYPPFSIPPFSWYIRYISTKTTTYALKTLQKMTYLLRTADRSAMDAQTSNNKHEKSQ